MSNQLRLIICLVGKICSGKSTVANSLSQEFSIPRSSFGGYLVHYSNINRLPVNRHTLQDLGESMIKEDPKNFLKETISFGASKSDSLILDGIRHKVIMEQIRSLPLNSIFIYIDADSKTRYKRYISREKQVDSEKGFNSFLSAEDHPVESEAASLRDFCDLIFDSENDSVQDLYSKIRKLA